MDVVVKGLDNKDGSKVKLPEQFNESVRSDLITRSVLAIESNQRQPYGADPKAGMKHSAELSRRRRKYRGSYGHGISRVPRKILSRRGTRFNWVGAVAPGTVGGRRAHPPKADKVWSQKINVKERRKAIRSALSATLNKEVVSQRGHKIPESYPFVISNDFETVKKTKDVKLAFEKLGLTDEMLRASQKSIRSGVGKLRGRKYKKRVGPLVVVSKECEIMKAAKNLPGVDIVVINKINAKLLAPGCMPGRLTLFTKGAIDRLEKENLFM